MDDVLAFYRHIASLHYFIFGYEVLSFQTVPVNSKNHFSSKDL